MRNILRCREYRQRNEKPQTVNYISSKKPHSSMSNDELKFKLTEFKSHTNALEMRFRRLDERLKRTITQHGITLKSKENEDMMNLMGSYGEDVANIS